MYAVYQFSWRDLEIMPMESFQEGSLMSKSLPLAGVFFLQNLRDWLTECYLHANLR